MAQSYSYKEVKTTTKKIVGWYDADKHTIEYDGVERDVLNELKDFNGGLIEIVMKVKEETDLAESE